MVKYRHARWGVKRTLGDACHRECTTVVPGMGNVVERRAGHWQAGLLAVSLLLSCVGLLTLNASVAQAAPVGVDWTSQTSAADLGWTSVVWGGAAGSQKFVAVANTGTTSQVMTSSDGITWALQADLGGGQTWTSVTWGGPTGQEKFVAVGGSGAVMTSSDGITWASTTFQGSGTSRNFKSVTWSAGVQKFYAVADALSDTAGAFQYSTDGVTWTSVQARDFATWSSVTWGGPTGQEKFVTVNSARFSNKAVAYSSTGLAGSWTLETAQSGVWKSVTWGGPSGSQKFVAVAADGGVMTSADGVTWVSRTPATSSAWSSVTWGGPTGDQTFVAVATGGQVMTSPDGITWTSQTSAANNAWNSVAWGGDKFAAVASSGTNNRVMTSVGTLSPSGGPPPDSPPPVLQQLPAPDSGSCDLTITTYDWGGSSSGGWTKSWAQWANDGTGGAVCTRTLVYSSALRHWIVQR